MLSSRALRQFIVVAEELHFGRAAARLHISQPPLSQAVMRLERELGVELLRRANRGVTLTEAGRGFLHDARRLVEQEAEAVARARRIDAGLSGRLTLGFVGSVSYELLPELLAQLRKHLPAISFDLRELPSTEQLEELRARRIDLGIVRLPLVDAGTFGIKVIRRERMIAVLPRRHRLAGRKSIPLQLLADEPFMMFPPERVLSLHAKTMMACHAAGFSPHVALQAWQMPTMVSLVAAGVGIALLPAQLRSSPHAGVVYRDVQDRSGHLDLEIALAWRAEPPSPLVQRVVEVMCARHEVRAPM